MKKDSQITFVLFTFNEEKRISYSLKNFQNYGNLLIVDNYSTDNTIAIAKEYGAQVLKYKNNGWAESEDEMNFVLKHIKTDWVCIMSVDEMIPKTCLDLYKEIVKQGKYKVVIQNKRTLLYQDNTDVIPGFISMHLFKKGAISFKNNTMHQHGTFSKDVKSDEILYLPPLHEFSIYHFSVYNTESFMRTLNTYSNVQANQVTPSFLPLRLIFVPIYEFFFHYIFGRLYTLGIKGFISSVEFSFYSFIMYAKVYEMKHNITHAQIEKDFQKQKNILLKQSPKSTFFKKVWAYSVRAVISRMHKYYKFKKK